jgi:hypothetical protein
MIITLCVRMVMEDGFSRSVERTRNCCLGIGPSCEGGGYYKNPKNNSR